MRYWAIKATGLSTAGLLVTVLCVGGCGSSTEPGPEVTFSPSAVDVSVPLDQSQLFEASVHGASGAETFFRLGGIAVASVDTYRYYAVQDVIDTLEATVQYSGGQQEWRWVIDVDTEGAANPPPAGNLAVAQGGRPGVFSVSWTSPPASIVPRPLLAYVVRIAYAALNNLQDWEEAELLEEVPSVEGQIAYQRQYDAAHDSAVHMGQEAWLAVRIKDSAGLLSPLQNVLQFHITAAYFLSGTVRDDTDRALGGVLVSYGCDTCKTITGVDGSFSLGPFRDIDRHVLTVSDDGVGTPGVGSYYDFRSDTLGATTPQPVTFVLLGQRSLGPACEAHYPDGFLQYFRSMTLTHIRPLHRPNYRLYKWDSYPLRVFVEHALNSSPGYALDSLACVAMAEWNQKLGEPTFSVVEDASSAQVDIVFVDTGPGEFHGLVTVVEPEGNYSIDEVIPVHVNVRIKKNFDSQYIQYAHEVVLHELGHVLCMGNHSLCGPAVDIMYSAPAGMIEAYWPELPISDSEAAVARAVRYLPQGVSMDQYLQD